VSKKISTHRSHIVNRVESVIPRLDPENLRIVILCDGALDARETRLMSTAAALHRHNIHIPQLVMCTTTNGVYQEPPDEDMFHLVHVGLGRTSLDGLPNIQLWDH
jgi:hypothetical protein